MGFWTADNTEPFRQFRWRIAITGTGVPGAATDASNLSYLAKKCDRPKAKIGSVQHKYLNHFFNFPGRVEWEDVNVTFVADPSSSQLFYKLLIAAGYIWPDAPTTSNQLATISKNKFVTALGSVKIEQLDSEGNASEWWELINPIFTSVQFGSLDYGSEEIVEITTTIKYDIAKYMDTFPSVPSP